MSDTIQYSTILLDSFTFQTRDFASVTPLSLVYKYTCACVLCFLILDSPLTGLAEGEPFISFDKLFWGHHSLYRVTSPQWRLAAPSHSQNTVTCAPTFDSAPHKAPSKIHPIRAVWHNEPIGPCLPVGFEQTPLVVCRQRKRKWKFYSRHMLL